MRRRGMDNVLVLVLSAAGIYAFLAIMMGVVPGTVLSKTAPGPGVVPLDAAAARGRDVYVGEGCSYCHTQQVRPLAQDASGVARRWVETMRTRRRSCWAPSAPDPT